MPQDQTPSNEISTEKSIEMLEEMQRRCNTIVDSLEGNPGWMAVCEDYEKTAKGIDDAWAYVTDDKHLYKLQVNKMGLNAILKLVETYKNERDNINRQLNILRNPKENVQKDFDNEA